MDVMSASYKCTYKSPIGQILIVSNNDRITEVSFNDEIEPMIAETPVLIEAVKQMDAWFSGDQLDFDLPLAPDGTAFQKKVWNEVRRIPFGKTVSYGDLAKILGDPNGARAVGMANGANPILLLIPCHRVTGKTGDLTGYAGGIDRKQFLLDFESNQMSLDFNG